VGVTPPFVGVAVNVTASPAQIVAPVEVMLTEAGTAAETIMVMVLDVAVVGDAHVALDVMITVTRSPFTRLEDVKVDEVAPPTLIPFICH
jgi:hypothetical protein